MALANDIQDWLVAEAPAIRSTIKWDYGTEAFWMAFTAAYPAFPGGEWPCWNPAIPMEGSYIHAWITGSQDDGNVDADGNPREDLRVVWEDFQQLVSVSL
jgi:hypothetical protein